MAEASAPARIAAIRQRVDQYLAIPWQGEAGRNTLFVNHGLKEGQDIIRALLAEVARLTSERDQRAADYFRDLAWTLSERAPSGKERIEYIALTPEDASDFVRHNDEPGYARTSLPFKIYRADPPAPAASQEPTASQGSGAER